MTMPLPPLAVTRNPALNTVRMARPRALARIPTEGGTTTTPLFLLSTWLITLWSGAEEGHAIYITGMQPGSQRKRGHFWGFCSWGILGFSPYPPPTTPSAEEFGLSDKAFAPSPWFKMQQSSMKEYIRNTYYLFFFFLSDHVFFQLIPRKREAGNNLKVKRLHAW